MSFRRVRIRVAPDCDLRFNEHAVVVGGCRQALSRQIFNLVTIFRAGVLLSSVVSGEVGILQGSEFFLAKRCSQFQGHVAEGGQKRK